jgi:hypothetical protein
MLHEKTIALQNEKRALADSYFSVRVNVVFVEVPVVQVSGNYNNSKTDPIYINPTRSVQNNDYTWFQIQFP